MDVRVLLESTGSSERFAALGTRVSPGSDVRRPDVALQVRRVAEHFGAVFARITTAQTVRQDRVSAQQLPAAVDLGAKGARVTTRRVLVRADQVSVQSFQFYNNSMFCQLI